MNLERPIYLTGFMASGKSSVGRRLSAALGAEFVDLDTEIERRAGRTIPELFASEGEGRFREVEREALRVIGQKRAVVVSVGGGALTVPDNMDFALATGTVVYLKASPDALAARLSSSHLDRPMLRGEDGTRLSGKALRTRVETLLAARLPHYERAHVTVETTGLPVRAVVDSVLQEIRTRATRDSGS